MKRKIITILLFIFLIIFILTNKNYASETIYYDYDINLSASTCIVDNHTSLIPTYDLYEYNLFLDNYNNNKLPPIYITNFLFDGIEKVNKITENDETKEIEITPLQGRILNINTAGNIKLSGSSGRVNTTIAINTNNVNKDINLYLNNIELESDKNHPAIMIYNKDKNWSDAKITIRTLPDTNNEIIGGKLKRVSTMLKKDVTTLSEINEKYSDINNKKYYYFDQYNIENLDNLLFYNEIASEDNIIDNKPYTFYKYNGVISSDVDLYFIGEGNLTIKSKNENEGIESKGDVIFQGGTGTYEFYTYDDAINATSEKSDISVNVESMYICIDDPEDHNDDGDGIDSNGSIHIEGGNIYSYGHTSLGNNGLDANETYLNKGRILYTGNLITEVTKASSQRSISICFDKIYGKGTKIIILNDNNKIVLAFEAQRAFKSITYSDDKLYNGNYHVYKLSNLSGIEENGIYTYVNNFTVEKQFFYAANSQEMKEYYNNNSFPEEEEKNYRSDFKISANDRTYYLVSEFDVEDSDAIIASVRSSNIEDEGISTGSYRALLGFIRLMLIPAFLVILVILYFASNRRPKDYDK